MQKLKQHNLFSTYMNQTKRALLTNFQYINPYHYCNLITFNPSENGQNNDI